MSDYILLDKHPEGRYAVVTLNRPERLNAFGVEMRTQFGRAVEEIHADEAIRAVVITGAGRAFSAGRDLKEVAERDAAGLPREPDPATTEYDLPALRGAMARSPKPWIAAINGLAVGGGLERTLDADIRIASTDARFATPEVARGVTASHAIAHLPGLVPVGEALYLLLTAQQISAAEAYRIGLVHELVAPERLIPRAAEIAETIGRQAPLAVAASKRAVHEPRLRAIAERESSVAEILRGASVSEDAREGARAFAEHREPRWLGR
ncbi:MAG: enoyl-CoA hydratase/isomerase family protein [Chloroflexi bacterium]|nr:enoyl-CoA hydratase/isomerase family protein [Chloroflexota bacterium]